MRSFEYLSHNEKETLRLGTRLAGSLRPGHILCLFGELGSGKTTFTKGIAQGLKINHKKVNSPTFILMNAYEGKLPLYHFDLYRMDDASEIANIGYEEFFYGDGIAVVEWAEKLGDLIPKEYLGIEFSHKRENDRLITFRPRGKRYIELMTRITQSRGNLRI